MSQASRTPTTATPKPSSVSNTHSKSTTTTKSNSTVKTDAATTKSTANTATASTGDSATSADSSAILTNAPTTRKGAPTSITSPLTSTTVHSSPPPKSQPLTASPPSKAASKTATSTSTSTSPALKIPGSKSENTQLARQVANPQKYLCYTLPHQHVCGHPSGTTSLLQSQRHGAALGYGAPCDSHCDVDDSRRLVLGDRCRACVPVAECLAVAMKHACGHLAGVRVSPGARHEAMLGAAQRCDAYCRSVQVDAGVGGACAQCTWSYCCMVWARCRCGHRDGVVAPRLLGANHVLNFGSSRAPCDARCRFRHKERIVGQCCSRCKPLMTAPAPVVPIPVSPVYAPIPSPEVGTTEPPVEYEPPQRPWYGPGMGATRKGYYEGVRW